MPTLHRTIVRPIITEASSVAYQDRGEYHFEVHRDANKQEIRQAVETLFGVKVAGVWTSNHRGKAKRVGQSLGRKPHWKRAIVKLADGDRIDQIFEG
jgi:large subunit ribosomal protein L23